MDKYIAIALIVLSELEKKIFRKKKQREKKKNKNQFLFHFVNNNKKSSINLYVPFIKNYHSILDTYYLKCRLFIAKNLNNVLNYFYVNEKIKLAKKKSKFTLYNLSLTTI